MTLSEKIQIVLKQHIQPQLEQHGGGINFVDFDEPSGKLEVNLLGMCNGCPHAQATISGMVEQVLQQIIPEVKQVVSV